MALTPKQQKLLEFIERFQNKHGFAPSQTEIAEHFRFKSLGTVATYLSYLKKGGFIKNTPHARRGLLVKNATKAESISPLLLPLLGKVAAGNPIEAIEIQSHIEVPPSLVKRGRSFVLQVTGNSMIEDGILDGDFIIVKKQNTAERGQMIVALVDDAATVKHYYPKSNLIELHPANSAYLPIRVSANQTFQIEGIVTGVIRKVG